MHLIAPLFATIGVLAPVQTVATAPQPMWAQQIAPLSTFDDTPMRAELDADGHFVVEVSVGGRRPTVHAVAHAPEDIVLRVAHDELGILRNVSLPAAFTSILPTKTPTETPSAVDDFGALARRDGVCFAGDGFELEAPAAADTIALFWNGGSTSFFGSVRQSKDAPGALVERPASEPMALRVSPAAARFDAAYCGTLDTDVSLRACALIDETASGESKMCYRFEVPADAMTLVAEGMDLRINPNVLTKRDRRRGLDPAPTPAIWPMVEVADAAGLHMVHFEGPREQLDIRPTMGPGAAFGDIDEDGALDLVVLQGGGREGALSVPDRVWLGRGDGTFRDVTTSAGIGSGDAGMGALLVDLDGDAHLDLYCANYGADRLFLGKGDGTFTEATELLPGHDLWSAGICAADYDGDGDLDLYVTSYLDYDPAKMPPADELGGYQREDPIEMLPFAFPGQRNVFLKNELSETGELGFTDVTEALGLLDVQGRGMQAMFWDFDLDGDQDLYIANDVSMNVLFRNEGDGTFKDVSFSTGLDDPRGGMGLALGDVDSDGDDDLFLTNWQLEANALYTNSQIQKGRKKRRRSSFHDSTVKTGLGRSGVGRTSWGAELFDADLDGDLDLYVANGYTSPDYETTGICVGQTDFFFRAEFTGQARGKYEEVNADEVPALHRALASRGAIGADIDRDGDVDLLVTANNGPLTLLRNQAERKGSWAGVQLRQQTGGNRFAVGATIEITRPDGKSFRRVIRAGQGYLTGGAPEAHFGLGTLREKEGAEDAGTTLRASVRWPDGTSTQHTIERDQWTQIVRPE